MFQPRLPSTSKIPRLLACICFSITLAFLLSSCVTRPPQPKTGGYYDSELQRWFTPSIPEQLPPTPFEKVVFLGEKPSDRKFQIVGYVVPYRNSWLSDATLFNAMRACAALHGADAIYIDREDGSYEWQENTDKTKENSSTTKANHAQLSKNKHSRAAAIRWE